MSNCLLELKLITGDHTGEIALTSQITLAPSLTGLNFTTKLSRCQLSIQLNRCQFPIQLMFTITINKVQGQRVNNVGIDLCKPVFTPGQLYVAFSYATFPQHISILLPEDCYTKSTCNVVYKEILLH